MRTNGIRSVLTVLAVLVASGPAVGAAETVVFSGLIAFIYEECVHTDKCTKNQVKGIDVVLIDSAAVYDGRTKDPKKNEHRGRTTHMPWLVIEDETVTGSPAYWNGWPAWPIDGQSVQFVGPSGVVEFVRPNTGAIFDLAEFKLTAISDLRSYSRVSFTLHGGKLAPWNAVSAGFASDKGRCPSGKRDIAAGAIYKAEIDRIWIGASTTIDVPSNSTIHVLHHPIAEAREKCPNGSNPADCKMENGECVGKRCKPYHEHFKEFYDLASGPPDWAARCTAHIVPVSETAFCPPVTIKKRP